MYVFKYNIQPKKWLIPTLSSLHDVLIYFVLGNWFCCIRLRCLTSYLPYYLLIYFFSFIFISWRLITLQYCSGFCHTLTWISHGFTCIPHADPPFHLSLHPIPLGLPSAPALSTCLMHPTWAGDLCPCVFIIVFFTLETIYALNWMVDKCLLNWIKHVQFALVSSVSF